MAEGTRIADLTDPEIVDVYRWLYEHTKYNDMPEWKHKPYIEKARAILSVVGKGSEGLDVGCGRGLLDLLLEAGGIHMTIVDHVDSKPVSKKSRFVVAPATALPFPESSFDFVVSTDMMEHMHEKTARIACNEMARVARRFVFLEISYAKQTRRWGLNIDTLHVTVQNARWWKALVEEEMPGFQIDKVLTKPRINRETGFIETDGLWLIRKMTQV